MDIQRIHALIRFILAVSSDDEDWKSRELGPIHIIKYVFLADMYCADKNSGGTYTGINWKFHSFGPWDYDFYKEIPNAVKMIGGDVRKFESLYDKDGERFSLNDCSPDDAAKDLPLSFVYLLQNDIRKFGSSTNELLHYVYTTPPMTNAVPGQFLDFSHPVFLRHQEQSRELSPEMTARGKKKQQQRIYEIREKIALQLETKRKKRIKPAQPRYDEIFFKGTMELDRDLHSPLEHHQGVLQVNESAWPGNWRKNLDLP
jgi:hypothetical protein